MVPYCRKQRDFLTANFQTASELLISDWDNKDKSLIDKKMKD